MSKNYLVTIFWDYTSEEPYENCTITYPSQSDFDYDGYNVISGPGRNGITIDIYKSLEEAILKSHFNPEYINYMLDRDDTILKNEILKNYTWDENFGLIKKQGD